MTENRFKTHEDLIVWQKSIDFAKRIYLFTRNFPKEETFGMVQQARRAAVSVPANIAEGQGRNGAKEFAQYLRIAKGSLAELRTYLVLSTKLEYAKEQDTLPMLAEAETIGKMLNGLHHSLEKFPKKN